MAKSPLKFTVTIEGKEWTFLGVMLKEVKQAIYQGIQEVATEAADWATLGPTQQLKRNIIAERPTISGSNVIGVVSVFAGDKEGKNYAITQHEESLNHLGMGPFRKGFHDLIEEGTRNERYWLGLEKAKGDGTAKKSVNKYLAKGLDNKTDVMVLLVSEAVRTA